MLFLMLLNSCRRSGSSNGSSGANKLDGMSASSNARATQKTELEKVSLSRDHTAGLNKERLVAKGSNKYVFILLNYLTKIRLSLLSFL